MAAVTSKDLVYWVLAEGEEMVLEKEETVRADLVLAGEEDLTHVAEGVLYTEAVGTVQGV